MVMKLVSGKWHPFTVKLNLIQSQFGILLILVMTLSIVGCYTTRQLTSQVDLNDPHPNEAVIIAKRSFAIVGGGSSFRVADGNELKGKLAPSGSIVWKRNPGMTAVVFDANYERFGLPMAAIIDAKAGKVYEFETSTYLHKLVNML